MLNFRLAWKFLRKELNQGDLTLLFMAIFIAIASLSSIGFLLKRIDHSMLNHAAQRNGAELILKSPTAISEQWLNQATQRQLQQASMVSFPSMLVLNEQFKLAQIKAVSDNFPLLGQLLVRPDIKQDTQIQQAPLSGGIYLDKRLYHFFNSVDSSIELGEAAFKTQGILESVPGQSSNFINIAPTALINLSDLEKTATIQAGSRVEYLYFFTGQKSALKSYQSWLKNNVKAGQSIRYGVEGIRAVSTNIEKANKFLSLAALLTVLLSAIAIIISRYHYGQKQYKNNAILLCLGLTENSIIKIELIKLLLLGVFASIGGIILGYLIHLLVLQLLSELIPKPLPELSFLPVWMGLGSGLLLIVTLSLANLFQLKKLSPMSILRKDIITTPINHYFLYSISFSGLFFLSWLYTQDVKLSLIFYALIFISILVLLLCAYLLIKAVLAFNQKFQLFSRLSMINLRQHQSMALIQITTFSLIFALVLIIYLSRTELLQQWQQQLPANTPNHFVINLQSYETELFRLKLKENNIYSSELFPMVRGRLSVLNDRPIKDSLSAEKQNHNALNRELNLSFAETMQNYNHLVEGQWWNANYVASTRGKSLPEISLENSLAKALDIKIGDKLGFQIGSQSVQGVVSNLRAVKWDSFKPNFYVIFPPNVLENFPLSYISSFHLQEEDKLLLNQLIAEFPGITIIEVDQILKEVQYIIEKIAIAINFVFVFILLAGLLVLISSLTSTLESRMLENAIIRTLGASAKSLRYSLLIELSIIALFSAGLGLLIAEVVSAVLYQSVFNLSYTFHPWLWLFIIVIALFLIVGCGLLFMNKIFTQSVNYSLKSFS